ncbi:YqkE family protein [Paenibacillus chungangensis]|uniref:YqkE family protein n=1 Tax=Paenibacillus chungangensis TaxID=696535 RepID=A0ABW3HN21_9BACL
MAKKVKHSTEASKGRTAFHSDGAGASLKELLGADVLNKLQAKAGELKQEQAKREEQARKEKEEDRRQEQKRLENDFSYLLNNSDSDWSKYK